MLISKILLWCHPSLLFKKQIICVCCAVCSSTIKLPLSCSRHQKRTKKLLSVLFNTHTTLLSSLFPFFTRLLNKVCTSFFFAPDCFLFHFFRPKIDRFHFYPPTLCLFVGFFVYCFALLPSWKKNIGIGICFW